MKVRFVGRPAQHRMTRVVLGRPIRGWAQPAYQTRAVSAQPGHEWARSSAGMAQIYAPTVE